MKTPGFDAGFDEGHEAGYANGIAVQKAHDEQLIETLRKEIRDLKSENWRLRREAEKDQQYQDFKRRTLMYPTTL